MSNKVCLFFSDTGGGHRSATDALDTALRRLVDESGNKPDVTIIKDNVAEKSHPINRFFAELYNYLLRHHQPLMKYYYWVLHAIRAEQGPNLILTADYFESLLLQHQPSVVVSLHPMLQYVLARAIKRLALKCKLVVVVTDPNADLWRAWACPGSDLTIVPNELTRRKLLEYGLPEEKSAVLGMPIHPDFLRPPSMTRSKFLSHLGLSADTLTICINAGWAGGGNMLKVYEALSQLDRPLQAIVLCGHNQSLYEQATAAAAASNVPTAVLPFHDCMSDLMASVDLMVTKAGGLTTYQAIARRLPLVYDVITEPMPQERGTIDMLVEQKLAYPVYEPHDIIKIVEGFQPDPNREQSRLPSAYEFDLTDGCIFEIAKKVYENCSPPIVLSPAVDAEALRCDSLPKSTANQAAGET
jgi:processive 1,2-diacylglycerol beta-glucosyltransferase